MAMNGDFKMFSTISPTFGESQLLVMNDVPKKCLKKAVHGLRIKYV